MNFFLIVIFLLGILLRFLYFPDNVYFAYDQARDSYTALEILKGDLKLVGPPSFLSDKLFPGPLIFYIYAPIYFFFDKNPEIVSAFFRIFNSLGIILTFLIGTVIFNKRIGLISAVLFAFSYEQTQYSLFISHQPLAVIPVLLFYLGLSLFIFKKNAKGLVLAALGWGLSIQFHYGYFLLAIPLLLILMFSRKKIYITKPKHIFLSFTVLFLTLSTFIISEIKYHSLSSYLFQNPTSALSIYPKETLFIINRFIHDIFIANYLLTPFVTLLAIAILVSATISKKDFRQKLLFLAIWFFGGITPYFLSGVPSYYYSAAASVSILIAFSYLIRQLLSKYFPLGIILLLVVLANNLHQITTINKTGVNSDMVIQPGMLTLDQKKAIDYIYLEGGKQPFSIQTFTVPLNINTTWSYIFEWYGQEKYGYLPTYGGETANGYLGNLKVIKTRSDLPNLQFIIIEPTIGIRESLKDKFFREEDYFTKIKEEKKFGEIVVQKRQKI